MNTKLSWLEIKVVIDTDRMCKYAFLFGKAEYNNSEREKYPITSKYGEV